MLSSETVPEVVVGTASDGARPTVEATAYPLFRAQDMRGLLTVLGGGAMMEGPDGGPGVGLPRVAGGFRA
jgi:hypothetical protein